MPVGEREEAGQRDFGAVEKGVEAGCLLMKFEQRSVVQFDVKTNCVSRILGAKRDYPADVGPACGSDASSALPEGEPRGDDNDAPELIHRLWCQLLAKPGRTRACVCVGSRTTAAMLS